MVDLAARKRIVDANLYMTLATADAEGRPWASPVWFAHEEYTGFVWVSKPEARHSQNLAARPHAGIVIFDSTVGQGGGRGGLRRGRGGAARGPRRSAGSTSSTGAPSHSAGRAGPSTDVRQPARLRVYGATASSVFVLGPDDERIAVELG